MLPAIYLWLHTGVTHTDHHGPPKILPPNSRGCLHLTRASAASHIRTHFCSLVPGSLRLYRENAANRVFGHGQTIISPRSSRSSDKELSQSRAPVSFRAAWELLGLSLLNSSISGQASSHAHLSTRASRGDYSNSISVTA